MADITALKQLSPEHLSDLCDLLIDCVDGGASVGFMAPLSPQRAMRFWQQIADQVERGERLLLVATNAAGHIIGSAQLVVDQPDNQPHRADVSKVLVHSTARRQGVGEALMRATERLAVAQQKSVLVLDTVTHSNAYRLYQRLGWQVVGDIPQYALMPNGTWCSTTYFRKTLPVREIRPLDAFGAAAAALLQGSTDAALALYPPESCHMIDPAELAAPETRFLGAWWLGDCVGCAALKPMPDAALPDGVYGEIKRVFVPDAHRGQGHAKALMLTLHQHARDSGLHTLRLETGPLNTGALHLYQQLGYQVRGRYGSYPDDPLSVFMELRLG